MAIERNKMGIRGKKDLSSLALAVVLVALLGAAPNFEENVNVSASSSFSGRIPLKLDGAGLQSELVNSSVEGLYRSSRCFDRRYLELKSGRYRTVLVGESYSCLGSEGDYSWDGACLALRDQVTGEREAFELQSHGFGYPRTKNQIPWGDYFTLIPIDSESDHDTVRALRVLMQD